VLVVDDSAINRTAFEAVLERDFSVTLAESGSQAIERCRTEEFAVIVLDVRMPGMDGFDTARVLRTREATRATPIIIFTSAYDQNLGQVTRGFDAGATDFLFTPVEPDLLKLKVTTYADIYRRHEELRAQVHHLQHSLAELHEELRRRGLAVTTIRARLDSVQQSASEIDRQTQ
jgi:two-component system, sporulation sensor kinase E